MRAPHLNRRLVLEEPVQVPDGAGGYSESWTPLGAHWCAVKPGTGREAAGGFVTVSAVPYRITLRATPVGSASRPRPEQRFRDGVRLFRILAVAERDSAARYLTCYAKEEVAS